MKSLGEALPEEQARVRELMVMYRDPMLNGSGAIAATLMEMALREADQAVMGGDVVAMLRAYESLKEFE